MQSRRIVINAAMSVVQVAVTGASLFILYRFLLNNLGVERFGVWSVVIATTSLALIGNFGFSASTVKFVAKYLAQQDRESAAHVVQTSVIFLGMSMGVILLLAYPLVAWLLDLVVPSKHIGDALAILPYAILSLWVSIIAGIFQAGLEGHQRIDLSSQITMATAVFYLIVCILVVPTQGLMGLAYARVAQACVLLFLNWWFLKRHIPSLPFLGHRWNQKLFREMIGYGLNFQLITVSQMLYDPITKGLLTKYGGLSMTGYYEMANRMVLQLRSLLVAATQVLFPAIAELNEKNSETIYSLYKNSYRILLYIALPFFSAIVAFTPIISHLWIGYYEGSFILFSMVLSLSWFFNTLVGPAYFANLGIGELAWNTAGSVLTAVLNLVLGVFLGGLWGGIAVVIAWVLSLITGNLVTLVSYHHNNKIPVSDIFPRENIGIGLASVAVLAIPLLMYRLLIDKLSLLGISGVTVFTIIAIIAFPLWQHPMRKRLVEACLNR